MICQKCGKHPATVHLKQITNGVAKEEYLCSLCASTDNSFFGADTDMSTESLLNALLIGGRPSASSSATCPLCGMTAREIQRSRRAGCAKCYEVFRNELTNAAFRIHGAVKHVGKAKEKPREETERLSKIEELKNKQLKAIEEQDFELAAKLRDEIKALNENIGKEGK